jgi:large conductance mechanosensitive channel
MWKEFKAFLIKQNAIALAIAVVIGAALNSVVDSLVKGFIMPIVATVAPDPKSWETAVTPGPIPFKVGLIASAILNFVIVGFIAWRLAKLFIKEAPAAAAKSVKACPFCLMGDLDPAATRCPHCTSDLAGALSAAPGGPAAALTSGRA